MTGQLPFFPPLFFGCWRSLRSCARAGPSTRRARPGKSSEEISDEGAPEKTFAGRRPREERQGLEGPERARTIRQDSSQKASQTTQGQGRRSPAEPELDPTAGRASGRPSTGCSAAETRASPASLPFHLGPRTTQRHHQLRLAAVGRRPAPGCCGMGGPPPPTSSESRPRRRTARGDRPRKTGHPWA